LLAVADLLARSHEHAAGGAAEAGPSRAGAPLDDTERRAPVR
jgi:hypothetical protein